MLIMFYFLCPEQDSNLHEKIFSQGPQPCVSTNSTTWAFFINLNNSQIVLLQSQTAVIKDDAQFPILEIA